MAKVKINPKVLKAVKYVGPAIGAIMAFAGDVENMQLKQTVAELAKRVADLEKK